MNIFKELELIIEKTLIEILGQKKLYELGDILVRAEPPRDKAHGDLATNVAMVLSKKISENPRDLAERICSILINNKEIKSAEVAGPGFINIRLKNCIWARCIKDVLKSGADYGTSAYGSGRRINVEYVSANPTGPLHAAHARGAVFGDALARLLSKVGFDVCREYYINDAGTQVDILARSTFLRYQEALGHVVDSIPEGYYPGDYLIVLGKELADRDGSKWSSLEESKWLPKIRSYAVNRLMKSIKDDLGLLGVEIDKYTSEHELVGSGKVEDVMKKLADKELIYKGVLERPKGKKSDDWEPRPQLLFKAKKFGDDVDRAIQKSDGSWTYFASDVAYHMDKFKRGYESMIDVWGADHGGYVQRMQAAVQAISDGKAKLDVKICQIVHLLQNGKPIRMSKRAGKFVTLADVVKAVGKDVVRFIMLSRRNDQVLEFDFDKVVAQSRENPVFYVQYAHARCCSVLRHAIEVFSEEALEPEALLLTDLSLLNDENELAVIKELASFPRVIESAAKAHEPHRLAFYLSDLAAAFHSLWNKGKDEESLRFILKSDVELTLARIALIRAIASVLAIGLGIMGIEPVREMKS